MSTRISLHIAPYNSTSGEIEFRPDLTKEELDAFIHTPGFRVVDDEWMAFAKAFNTHICHDQQILAHAIGQFRWVMADDEAKAGILIRHHDDTVGTTFVFYIDERSSIM